MCLGLPCVSTKVSGAKDLIDNGKNGLLVELNDIQSMTNALNTIVEDKQIRAELGKNAIKVFDLLQLEIISMKWINLLKLLS